jgi:hypothetical protein
MGYVSLLIIPFLWLASLPLPDGEEWHVLRVIRGHARAFWISPGMDQDQVRLLLGEDGEVGCCGLVDGEVTERDYPESDIGVILGERKGEPRRVTRVFSWPVLRVWWNARMYILRRVDGVAPEFTYRAMSEWKRVMLDIPAE